MGKHRRLRAVALKLWFAVVILTLVAAGIAFVACRADPAKAHGIMAAALRVGGKVCVVAGLLTLACDACVLFGKPPAAGPEEGGARRYVSSFLVMAALATAGVTALWLDPQILDAWDQVKSFGDAGAGDPALMRFKCLVGMNVALLALQAFFVIVAVSLKPKAPAAAASAQSPAPDTKPSEGTK